MKEFKVEWVGLDGVGHDAIFHIQREALDFANALGDADLAMMCDIYQRDILPWEPI